MLYLLFALIDRWLAPVPRAGRCDWLTMPVYAHRGFHGAAKGCIENSPGAFAAAIAAGLGIECDVQRSRDGQAVVFHDEDLSRLTGKPGRVADESAASLAQIVLTGSTDTIPLLTTLLAQIGGRVPLLVEVKIARAGRVQSRVQPLCLAVNRALEGYGGQVAIMSFDPRVCSWFRHYSPHIVRGLVMTEASWRTLGAKARRHLALWRARPDFLAYDVGDIGGAFPVAQRRRGMPLLTWTVDNAAKVARAGIKADAPIAEGEGLTQLLGAQ